jgi:lipopolysaccharide/colanic/teichoic acid biosynthesis glycosyltransferase
VGSERVGLTPAQRLMKRAFDILLSAAVLIVLGWLMVPAIIGARFDTGRPGIFRQQRVGLHGRYFNIMKIRTMRDHAGINTHVTVDHDPRISRLGRLFRKTKIDELPQLINVLRGDMSFVGPRPDVPGYADRLTGRDRVVLEVRPGITGPATLKYRDESALLAQHSDPEKYNDEVLFPDKVRINRQYVENYSMLTDLYYIFCTLSGRVPRT